MKRIYAVTLIMNMLIGIQGCSVVTIMSAPAAKYDAKVLVADGFDMQVMTDNFGEPVETISYVNSIILRRDLHEYQIGIKHKIFYSLLSGSAAIYTLGISELSSLPIATEAAHATDSLRVYYGADSKAYGSASYSKKIGMWLPNSIENEGSFKDGFPCHDFTAASRNVMADVLVRSGRPDLVKKITRCLSLERVQVAGNGG